MSLMSASLSNSAHSKDKTIQWWGFRQKILMHPLMSASETKMSHASHHGRSSFCCVLKPPSHSRMSLSSSFPRYIKPSLWPVLDSHLSTTLLLCKFRKAYSKEEYVPKRPRRQDDVLSPLFLAFQHVSKLQNTNACEPKYLPRFLDVLCAPAFLPTSQTLPSKLRSETGMWESSFSNS